MQFKTFGVSSRSALVFLHGGGLSWWMWQKQIEAFQPDYYVIAPVIDGHDIDADVSFTSIPVSADRLISYIDTYCGGRVKLLAGLSIGAQIICEILARRPDIAEYAVIESALLIPMPAVIKFGSPMIKLSFGLIQRRWFARLQAKQLCLPESMFEAYYTASKKMSLQSLIYITLSNAVFSLNPKIAGTSASVLIIAGGKEPKSVQASAKLLNTHIPGSELIVLPGYRHGQFSLSCPEAYIQTINNFMKIK